jgi:peptide/nickel transport system permease protein
VLVAVLGQGMLPLVLALVTAQYAYFARTAYGAATAERQKDYIEAARATPLSSARIIFGHILPNCLPPLLVVATVQVANAIALEATLSFLGLGLPPTEPSLGMLIANGFPYMMSGRSWISVYPGVALIILIVAINLVGDQLRDQFNPRLRR